MLEILIITFREGLEAFLIVAIMAAYLLKTDRRPLLKPLIAGIITALIISATTGWHVAELAQSPIWEGILALASGALVASFTAYMMINAKNIRGDIHSKMERHTVKTGMLAAFGVFIFTVLMIAREGMETAMMLGSLSAKTDAGQMWAGAVIGIVAVAIIGFFWVKQSDKINLKLFMQVTGIFLILFSLDLLVYGIHELSEMYAIPFIGFEGNQVVHDASEVVGENSLFAKLITYCLLIVPAAWLILSYLDEKIAFDRKAYQ